MGFPMILNTLTRDDNNLIPKGVAHLPFNAIQMMDEVIFGTFIVTVWNEEYLVSEKISEIVALASADPFLPKPSSTPSYHCEGL